MAAGLMKREPEGNTLEATALVHEVYLKLVDTRQVGWTGKAHFFGACAKIMRRILVDAARKRSATRHGGGMKRFNVDEVLDLTHHKDSRLIAAALIVAGVPVVARTHGFADHPDVVVAAEIARRLGIEHLVRTPAAPGQQVDVLGRIRATVLVADGMLSAFENVGRPDPAASAVMCAASATSTSEPVITAPMTSAIATTVLSTSAVISAGRCRPR